MFNLPSSPMPFRCLCVVICGSSTNGVDVLECGSKRGLRGAPLVLTDDATVSVFIDSEVCDWQIAAVVLLVLPPLLLLLVVYRGYGWNLYRRKCVLFDTISIFIFTFHNMTFNCIITFCC